MLLRGLLCGFVGFAPCPFPSCFLTAGLAPGASRWLSGRFLFLSSSLRMVRVCRLARYTWCMGNFFPPPAPSGALRPLSLGGPALAPLLFWGSARFPSPFGFGLPVAAFWFGFFRVRALRRSTLFLACTLPLDLVLAAGLLVRWLPVGFSAVLTPLFGVGGLSSCSFSLFSNVLSVRVLFFLVFLHSSLPFPFSLLSLAPLCACLLCSFLVSVYRILVPSSLSRCWTCRVSCGLLVLCLSCPFGRLVFVAFFLASLGLPTFFWMVSHSRTWGLPGLSPHAAPRPFGLFFGVLRFSVSGVFPFSRFVRAFRFLWSLCVSVLGRFLRFSGLRCLPLISFPPAFFFASGFVDALPCVVRPLGCPAFLLFFGALLLFFFAVFSVSPFPSLLVLRFRLGSPPAWSFCFSASFNRPLSLSPLIAPDWIYIYIYSGFGACGSLRDTCFYSRPPSRRFDSGLPHVGTFPVSLCFFLSFVVFR